MAGKEDEGGRKRNSQNRFDQFDSRGQQEG